MTQKPSDLIHLAYDNPPTLCGLPHEDNHVLYVPDQWHQVPRILKCPTCDMRYKEFKVHGFN